MRAFIIFLLLHVSPLWCAESVFIIIHGTWGLESNWYMPGGDFFNTLETVVSVRDSAVVPFCWSGGCGHASRLTAANNLVKLINSYDRTVAIYLIAHSHGGNVATLASQILGHDAQNNHKIRALYTLGTPIMSNYLPDMDVILYVYNLFSLEDCVQPVLGISTRVFPHHKRIANVRVFIDGKEPGHTALHDEIIAQWLPLIHQKFKQFLREHMIYNTIAEPSIIYFDHAQAPEFMRDTEREKLLMYDRQLTVALLDSFRNSLDTGSRMPLIKR